MRAVIIIENLSSRVICRAAKLIKAKWPITRGRAHAQMLLKFIILFKVLNFNSATIRRAQFLMCFNLYGLMAH